MAHDHGKKPAATKPRAKAGRRPTKEHWRRDIPNFYNFLAFDRAPLKDVPDVVGGLTGALMSKDLNTGAHTFVVELPPKFKKQYDGKIGALEFFTLSGDLSLNGDKVGAAGYLHLPQGCGGGEVRSETGALCLVWWNPNAPAYPPPYTDNRTLKIRDMEWVYSLPDYHGLMHKSLRLPDPSNTPYQHPDGFCADGPPGGYLRYTFIAPGIKAPYEHVHHECFEEIIMIGGDTLLADEGIMAPGTVTCHPQEWWHGPFASRTGALIIVHTDAPMGYPWPPRDYPFQEEVCNAYMDESRYDVPAQHTDWADTPWVRFQQKDKFKKWEASKDAAEYGNVVGRDVNAKFRGSIHRDA
jgi:hypothetical protein